MERRINPLVALLIVGAVIFVLFKLASWLFTALSFLAPVLLILALVIKSEVVINYGKWLWKNLTENTLMGIIFTLLTIVGFPFVAGFLFLRALNYDRWKQFKETRRAFTRSRESHTTEEAEFEILDEEPLILEEREKVRRDNDYDDIF